MNMYSDLNVLSLFDNLVNFLGDYEKRGYQIKFDCPKCDEGNKKNLECNYQKKIFNCWSCGYKGSLYKLFKHYAPHTLQTYSDYFKIDTNFKIEEKKVNFPTLTKPFFKFDFVKNYLIDVRKIQQEILLERKVKYVYDESEYYVNNIFYPFYENGQLISGCLYNLSTKKYRNLTALNFVPYKEFIDKNYPITLTEGVIDCFSAVNAIPLLGTSINKEILEFLYDCKVIVALDTKVKIEHYIELLRALEKYNIKNVETFNLNGYEDMNEYYINDYKGFICEYKNLYNKLMI